MKRREGIFACMATAAAIVLGFPLGAHCLMLPNDAEQQDGEGQSGSDLLKEVLPLGDLSVGEQLAAEIPMSGATQSQGPAAPSRYCADSLANGVTLSEGDLIVDLSVGTSRKLTIYPEDIESCRENLTSVEFTYSRPAVGYVEVEISGESEGGGAFSQTSEGDNVLKRLVFPEGLQGLKIGAGAFTQRSVGGDNALESVAFPQSLDRLEIGRSAFSQSAGRKSALAAVSFPAALERLVIDDEAFLVDGEPSKLFMFFPTEEPPAAEVELGRQITRAGTPWVWLGVDGLTTSSASWQRSGNEGYALFAAGRAAFVPNGGELQPGAPSAVVVFPEVDGQPQASEEVVGLNPAGFSSPVRNYSVELPHVERTGARIAGWCPTQWVDSECPDQTGVYREGIQPPVTVSLSDGALQQTFFAGWAVDNIPGPTVSENACGMPLIVAVPPPADGLYEYVVSSSAESVTITAVPGHSSVLLKGPTMWESSTFAPPCSVQEFAPSYHPDTGQHAPDVAEQVPPKAEQKVPPSLSPGWLVGIASILLVSLTALGGTLFGLGKGGAL